jgi:prepilin-type N-terminal cleavage/methylation domain-containing protein
MEEHVMQQIALLNKRGLTLIEVLIALVVMLIVFLALMQTALVSIDSNMINVLRNEAVNVAEIRMNDDAKNISFTTILSDSGSLAGCNCPTGFPSTGICFQRGVRSISNFNFCTNLACTELGGDGNCATNDADNKQVTVMVGWKWKGENYTHSITTIRKR